MIAPADVAMLRLPPAVAAPSAGNVLKAFRSFAYDACAVVHAGRLSYWDALLLTAADRVGVKTMLSDDMSDDPSFGGLEVVNLFGRDGPSERARQMLQR